jgi:hypothetical protein
MTEQEILQKISETKKAISALKGELMKFRREYISTYAPYPKGTKVRVIGTKDVGIILGYDFRYNTLRPLVAKMKNDGTAHATARLFVLGVNSIEKVEV